ncbi:MAG: AI-2E family transporter [Candidatus Pelethousia sp.]|nr:AI-2E family transporter [Candidatus Pelethousia sp.]
MENLWKSVKKYLLLVAFGVLLYELCENLPAVRKAISDFFSILQPLFIGIAIAFIVNMPMRFLETKIFVKWKDGATKRGVCLTVAYLFVIAIIVAMLLLIIPRMVESIASILTNFDSYMDSLSAWASDIWTRVNLREDVVQMISNGFQRTFGQLDDIIAKATSAALKGAVSVISLAANTLIAFILSLYVLFNKEKFLMQSRRLVNAIFEENTARRILEICSRTNTALNSYFYGMIIDCFLLGTMCFIAMSIFRFPYALLISATIGFTQVVPIVGPWLGGIVGALLILFVNPPLALWFVVLLLAVQQIDNNLVYPRVVGNAVGISGIWVLIAILLGGGLWGLGGIVLSVPLMAVCYTIVGEWVNKRLESKRQ